MKKGALAILMLCFVVAAFGQEGLAPLGANKQLQPANRGANVAGKALDQSNLVYVIDTITQLPFVDDFTRNNVKQFNANPNDPQYQTVYRYKFTVNDYPYDVIAYTDTPQYEYVAGPGGRIDSVQMPPTEVVLYEDEFPYLVDTTIWVWLRGIPMDLDTIPDTLSWTSTTLVNISDTLIIVPDDGSLWTGGGTFVNNNYAVDAPTYGVATFDGLDSVGLAYDFSTSSTYGKADKLTSKPIDLSFRSPADSLYLSFYYQPQGHGNKPEENDSLVLEFFAPSVGDNGSWKNVWAMPGSSLKEFEQVLIAVRAEEYFERGFQFRFRNYATLAGNLDHWNIDYVLLNTNRSSDDRYRTDSGWRYLPSSYILDYTSMPYEHYKTNPTGFTLDLYDISLQNLENPSASGANLSPMRAEVQTLDGTMIHGPYAPTSPNTPGILPGDSTFSFLFNGGNDPFQFPSEPGVRNSWLVTNYFFSQNDEVAANDTSVQTQVFDTYYSYDDGTAEKGYGLIGVGANMAQEFSMPAGVSDTLKAVNIYFPQMLDNLIESDFKIVVWTGESGPTTEVYRGFNVNPIYTEYGSFQRYELFDEVIVTGTYFVGIEQVDAAQIYVGFDENIDNSDKIWFNIGSGWEPTSFTGSLMIRPDFGEELVVAGMKNSVSNELTEVKVWPNPASSSITIAAGADVVDLDITLTDLSGRVVWAGRHTNGMRLQLPDNMVPGMYLLTANNIPAGVRSTHRIMVVD